MWARGRSTARWRQRVTGAVGDLTHRRRRRPQAAAGAIFSDRASPRSLQMIFAEWPRDAAFVAGQSRPSSSRDRLPLPAISPDINREIFESPWMATLTCRREPELPFMPNNILYQYRRSMMTCVVPSASAGNVRWRDPKTVPSIKPRSVTCRGDVVCSTCADIQRRRRSMSVCPANKCQSAPERRDGYWPARSPRSRLQLLPAAPRVVPQ